MSQALLHRSRVSAGGLHGSLASSLLVVRGRCVYRCTAVICRSSIASAMTTATSPATDDHYIVDLEPEYFAFGATYKTSCCSTDSERPHRCCCMLIISTACRIFPNKSAPFSGGIQVPSNTRFLGRAHTPNNISIGSAVLAQLVVLFYRHAAETLKHGPRYICGKRPPLLLLSIIIFSPPAQSRRQKTRLYMYTKLWLQRQFTLLPWCCGKKPHFLFAEPWKGVGKGVCCYCHYHLESGKSLRVRTSIIRHHLAKIQVRLNANSHRQTRQDKIVAPACRPPPPRRRPGRQLRLAARPPTRSDVVRHGKFKNTPWTVAYD